MSTDNIPPISQIDDAASPKAQISALVGDVRSLAAAEWDYAKARLSYSGNVVRKAGVYAMLAVITLSGAAIALILGILLIVAHYWGPWLATVTVVLAFLGIATILAVLARNTARNLSFSDDADD